jgi:hypothetical protein
MQGITFAVWYHYLHQLRTVGGYTSIHHFLTDKYGRKAVGLFSFHY